MKDYLILLSLFLGFSPAIVSQDYWYKEYKLDSLCDERLSQIYLIDDKIYLVGNHNCIGYRHVTFYQLDTHGVLNWTENITPRDFSYGEAIMYCSNRKEFIYTGLNFNADTTAYVDHLTTVNLNGQVTSTRLIDYGDFFSDDDFPQGILSYEDGYVIYGITERRINAKRWDGSDGFLTFLNHDLSVDTSYILGDGDWGGLGGITLDQNGQLWGILGNNADPENRASIFDFYLAKIGRNYFWQDSSYLLTTSLHSLGRNVNHYNIKYFEQSNIFVGWDRYNFRMGITIGDPNIHAFDHDGKLLWEIDEEFLFTFLPEDVYSSNITPEDMEEMDNGDILMAGHAVLRDISAGWDRFDQVPFIIRITPNGEVVWFRYIYKDGIENLPLEKSNDSWIRDATIDEDGSIYCVGGFIDKNNPNNFRIKGFAMKLSPDGCINENNCGLFNTITTQNEEIPDHEHYQLYPNPANQYVQLDLSVASYQIYNQQGQKVLSGKNYTQNDKIDVSYFAQGIYIFLGRDRQQRIVSRKFLVE